MSPATITLEALRYPSKRLVLSYFFDWFAIIAIVGVGGGINWVSPYYRPFSLLDLTISYPTNFGDQQISVGVLIAFTLIAPGFVIFLVCLFFVPGPKATRRTPKSLVLRRKFWEWNTGWMGLGLSLASAFLITQGLKNLLGKPRPDMLSRCNPDLANIERYYVGGYGQTFNDRWMLVSVDICQQTDRAMLDDGFRSFPSGHSSFSWAGLLYLTLFLASKFSIAIPYLPPRPFARGSTFTAIDLEKELRKRRHSHEGTPTSTTPVNGARFEHGRQGQDKFDEVPLRNQNAAAPVYLLIIAFIPAAVALYVNCTRYTDFAHHGWDIVAGSLIGIMTAVFSFRWYHLPISQGAGWAWGARSRDRAFGIPVGTGSYVGSEGWSSASAPHRDVEAGAAASDGTMLTSPGVSDQAMDEHPFPVVDANGSAQPQLQR